MRLPEQLAEVDPIVASFCGGAVGVLSTLMVVESNNAAVQAKRRCFYCEARAALCAHDTLYCDGSPPAGWVCVGRQKGNTACSRLQHACW